MLKLSYQVGVKLALLEAGLISEEALDENENEENGESEGNAADQLADILKKIPDPGTEPKAVDGGIGDPGNDTSYGTRSANYAFDDLSHLGLDIQGPTSTAV